MSQQTAVTQKIKPPLSPYLVLVVAIILPGVGQVLNNAVARGLIMLVFMISLGYFTYQVASPNVSIVGKLAGGIFVYALSVMDAFYVAKIRDEVYKHGNLPPTK